MNCPSMGECARRYASLFRKHLALGGWTPRNEALMEIVVKHVRTSQAPVVDCL